MGGLRTILRLEWRLFVRRRRLILMALALVIFGAIAGRDGRALPLRAWGSLTNTAAFVAFMLAALAGDGITRSRDAHLEDVLLSTPLRTSAYVCGAYLAELLGAATLSLLFPVVSLLVDHGRDPAHPSIGPTLFVAGWIWLVLVPVAFGVAVAQLGMLMLHGRRVLVVALMLACWVLPGLAPGRLDALDISTIGLAADQHMAQLDARTFGLASNLHIKNQAAGALAHAVSQHLPPQFPPIFVANRALVLLLTGLCLSLSVGFTSSYRLGIG